MVSVIQIYYSDKEDQCKYKDHASFITVTDTVYKQKYNGKVNDYGSTYQIFKDHTTGLKNKRSEAVPFYLILE